MSLLATAMWTLSSDVLAALQGQTPRAPSDEMRFVNPLVASYGTSDGRHIQLVFLEADRYWADFCRLIGRDDLLDDPRFVDLAARREHAADCVAALREEFATRTFAEWKDLLASIDAPWAPVQAVEELLTDWATPPMPIHLVSPSERRHSAKVKAFADHVAKGMV